MVQGSMNGNAGSIVEEIQKEIMNNGSVSAVLTVYNVGVQILRKIKLNYEFHAGFYVLFVGNL